MKIHHRQLYPKDQSLLEAFLLQRLESSMFLYSNMKHSGLVDGDSPYQGLYFGSFQNGQLVGVVAHYWNGLILVQAQEELSSLLNLLTQVSNRPIKGVIGLWEQVCKAKEILSLSDDVLSYKSKEKLYHLGGPNKY